MSAHDGNEFASEFAEVERLFAAERALFARASAPVDPREEADPTFARLRWRAARSEQALREGAVGTGTGAVALRARQRWRWLGGAIAAAAVVAVALFALRPGRPDDRTLGRALGIVLLDQQVSAQSPRISWQAVPGAQSYDAVIVDRHDRAVLTRAPALARGTTWELAPGEIERLRALPGALRLRVVALDGAGIEVGTSGDRALSVR